jgi:hypothetical protein
MWEDYGFPIWGKKDGISKHISGKISKECPWNWKEVTLQREKQVIHGG